MDYDEVVAAFFQPSGEGTVPPAAVGSSPARRLRDAIEPIAMHAVWCRRTNEQLARRGLDFLSAYVWGRAAALGEPSDGAIVAAFAVFEPGMLVASYHHFRAACSRDDLVAERTEATIASLSEVLAGVDVALVADRLVGAITTVAADDVVGRPLFAGLASQPWPHDPIGRLWRACDLLREHRGDAHIAACVAAGLGPVTMNVLTELWIGMPLGSYSATRGWTPEQIARAAARLREERLLDGDELSARGRTWRADLEANTDTMERSVVDALGGSLDSILAPLEDWSARCIAAGAFPPAVSKRAAG